jgi:hypothetical protein
MAIKEQTPEMLPIVAPLEVIDYRTIKKGSGWWLAVVLVESWEKRNIGIYLWQKKKDGKWHRKQKFSIHTKEKWDLISKAVNDLFKDMGPK